MLFMGPQLFFGCCMLIGHWWWRVGQRSESFSPFWKASREQFFCFLCICYAIFHMLPSFFDYIFAFVDIEQHFYAVSFLCQLFLLLFLCRTVRRNAFSFADGLQIYMKPMERVLRSCGAYLRGVPILFVVSAIWMFFLVLLDNCGMPISFGVQGLLADLEDASPIFIIESVFIASVVAPISEELLFRGALYRYGKMHLSAVSSALITSFLFALLHWNLCAFLPLFVLSLLLTRTYERTGNIAPCIGFHALFNFNNIALTLLTFKYFP
ncbi:MAG: CPBP family intramembrane metalloprotease [Puniceicoccales bacterium]|nr:CPBP family intramembrane metalloprotease [Puniceicoccales bacterium]